MVDARFVCPIQDCAQSAGTLTTCITLRHTYRAWLHDVGTPIGVMKDLVRHSDIHTAMNRP
jgi:integrase